MAGKENNLSAPREELSPEERYADVANPALKTFLTGLESAPLLKGQFPVPVNEAISQMAEPLSQQLESASENQILYSPRLLRNFGMWLTREDVVPTQLVMKTHKEIHAVEKDETRVTGALLWGIQLCPDNQPFQITRKKGIRLQEDVKEHLGSNYLSDLIIPEIPVVEESTSSEPDRSNTVFQRDTLGEWGPSRLFIMSDEVDLHGSVKGILPGNVLRFVSLFTHDANDLSYKNIMEGMRQAAEYCQKHGFNNLQELYDAVKQRKNSHR